MEFNEYLEKEKQEINQEMQTLKDRFIDEILMIWNKRIQDFGQEWNRLVGKKAGIDEKQAQSDRLNK